ncbi:MAG: hypothetical protein J2P18_21280, partial [Nocardia sp.]|nr:hypothetical protein [Nocardia sp.]
PRGCGRTALGLLFVGPTGHDAVVVLGHRTSGLVGIRTTRDVLAARTSLTAPVARARPAQ